jgi:hypothetical protein
MKMSDSQVTLVLGDQKPLDSQVAEVVPVAFDMYCGGYRVGLGVLHSPTREHSPGDTILVEKSVLGQGPVFVIRAYEVGGVPQLGLDDVSAIHNRQRVLIESAVVLIVNGRRGIVACAGSSVLVPLIAHERLLCTGQTLKHIYVCVTLDAGACPTLTLSEGVPDESTPVSKPMPEWGWNAHPSPILPTTYRSRVNQPGCGVRLEMGNCNPEYPCVRWRCPASHPNKRNGACSKVARGGTDACGASVLTPYYEISIYGKGSRFIRYSLSEEISLQILGPDHAAWVGVDGAKALQRAVTSAIVDWRDILVQRQHPSWVGKKDMPVHVIVAAQ